MAGRRSVDSCSGLLALTMVALLVSIAASSAPAVASAADDVLMCGWKVEPRTQYVSIDPALAASGVSRADVLAAFEPWNMLFEKYHGYPIFAEYTGDWWAADVLVTAQGSERTWVANRCTGYQQRGANHSVVYLGWADAWRNRQILTHELGHTLGLADFGDAGEASDGHVAFRPCGSYVGVMSYCTAPQSWFLDTVVPGLLLDGQVVRDY